MQIRRAANEARHRRRFERDVRLRGSRRDMPATADVNSSRKIEIHPFGLLDALLDPRRRAQRAQDGLQALTCLRAPA